MLLPPTLLLRYQASGLCFHPVLSHESNILHLAFSTLPVPELHSFPINPLGLHPSFILRPNLEHFPGTTIQDAYPNDITVNPWRDTDPQHHPAESPPVSSYSSLDYNSNKRLEYHLESALDTVLGVLSSADNILSPRAHNTLKALNALVSVEKPVSGPMTIANDDPPTRFNNVTKNVTKWLGFPQSPKKQDKARYR
jgi:hypothetical protein